MGKSLGQPASLPPVGPIIKKDHEDKDALEVGALAAMDVKIGNTSMHEAHRKDRIQGQKIDDKVAEMNRKQQQKNAAQAERSKAVQQRAKQAKNTRLINQAMKLYGGIQGQQEARQHEGSEPEFKMR